VTRIIRAKLERSSFVLEFNAPGEAAFNLLQRIWRGLSRFNATVLPRRTDARRIRANSSRYGAANDYHQNERCTTQLTLQRITHICRPTQTLQVLRRPARYSSLLLLPSSLSRPIAAFPISSGQVPRAAMSLHQIRACRNRRGLYTMSAESRAVLEDGLQSA
jgi:hypothetical protein